MGRAVGGTDCWGIRSSLGLPATRMLGWWIRFLWLRWQSLCLVTLSCLSAALAKWLPLLPSLSLSLCRCLLLSFSSFHKLEEMCVAQKLLLAFLLRRCSAKRLARRGQGRRQRGRERGPGTMHGCWPHKLSSFLFFGLLFSSPSLAFFHFLFQAQAGLMLLRLPVFLSNRWLPLRLLTIITTLNAKVS